MRVTADRALFGRSYLFQKILEKINKSSVSFMNDPNNIVDLAELRGPLKDMSDRGNLSAYRQIAQAITNKQIEFIYDPKCTSGIVYIPIMDANERTIIGVRVNLSKFAKRKAGVVDMMTGELRNVLDIKYEMMHTLLFGAIAILNAQRCFTNPNLVKYIRTLYVDIIQQIMNRTFGNPIYGDKFRFILEYFFHNGEIDGLSLATSTKFDEGKYRVLKTSYPEFFSGDKVNLGDLLEIIAEEFPNMKDVTLDKFVSGATTFLGESGMWMVDNQVYYLGMCAAKCKKEGRNIFGGMLLKELEKNASQISNLILQSI